MRSAAGLAPLLAPNTIAVIGASRRYSTIGHQIGENLISYGFAGAVYPVNPHARFICAVRAYPGGPGILAADALVMYGLQLADFDATTIASLRPLFPAEASICNPPSIASEAQLHKEYHELMRNVRDRAPGAKVNWVFIQQIVNGGRETDCRNLA